MLSRRSAAGQAWRPIAPGRARNLAIAERLGITVPTVKRLIAYILDKVDSSSRAQAVARAQISGSSTERCATCPRGDRALTRIRRPRHRDMALPRLYRKGSAYS